MNAFLSNLSSRHLVLILALSLALSVSCRPDLQATRTPTVTQGTTVFSAVYWNTPDRAMNIVFVPDAGYGDMSVIANRQRFLDDVADQIYSGFWQSNGIFRNITLFNFWFMTLTGRVTAPSSGICPAVTFPDLTDAAFAEMVVVLHRNTAIRDCGGGARASSQAGTTNWWISVHESGHAIFGLPDEYCCDGGYWNASPILYSSQAACNGDAANAAWRNCQSYTANNGSVWWRSEDTTSDVMSAGGPPTLQYGRADWVLVRNRLTSLPGASVNNPSVFAPATWHYP